jgi:putative tributyrin esterase
MYCGTNDSLYNANCKFRDFAIKNELDVSFRDDEGNHNFYYWNKELKTFFETINNSQ